MRRKERIKEILKIIEDKWMECPDQRLGQLLQNYFGYPRGDIFFKEDTTFGVKVFDGRTTLWDKKQRKGMRKMVKELEKEFSCKRVK